MPTRPRSHSQRLGRREADRAYDQTQRRLDPALAAAKRLRSSLRWRRVRARVLARSPLCADPEGRHAASGRIAAAVEVDHIQGLRQRPDLAFDEANLQPLCHACHARKTAQERPEGPGRASGGAGS
jgi:5-methylcytosine-specific restriction protein A